MENAPKSPPAAPVSESPATPQLSPEAQAAADKLRHEVGMKFFRRLAR